KVLNFRKSSVAIHRGKTVHFSPENGIYTLFRYTEDEMVMLVLNKNEIPVSLDLRRFDELGIRGAKADNLLSGEAIIMEDRLLLRERGPVLLSLKRKRNE
ncbi:MAG: cyclomaltodextrinase C-terminal domain-containing protein, partial [Flavobacteriaceae bacterium]|nr:cyclomaltodextrinase C-terminal domain-containing protein [Flavobacteriaceae bacterium]